MRRQVKRRARPLLVLVDENPETCSAVAQRLKTAGYHVVSATEAERGLKLLEIFRPAAFVARVGRSRQHGWAVCGAARSQLWPCTPVLLISNQEVIDEEIRARARHLGIAVLVKPDCEQVARMMDLLVRDPRRSKPRSSE